MKKTAKLPDIEWSVHVRAEEITGSIKKIEIAPDADEKAALAKRLDIVALNDLQAQLQMNRTSPHIIHVKGQLQAKVTQNCVITLEPVETDIKDEFEAWYSDQSEAISFKKAQREAQTKKELLELPMLEEEEDPEPVINGQIDLGDLVTQYLSLSIPAYPTKEGLSYSVQVEEPKEKGKNPMKLNPFAALKDWRPKD